MKKFTDYLETKIVAEANVPYSPIMKKYGKDIVEMVSERMSFHKASFSDVKKAFESLFNNLVESDLEDYK